MSLDLSRQEDARRTMLGYPLNMRRLPQDVRERCAGGLDFLLNNLGDPFTGGTYRVNTFDIEREVVEHFANFFTLPRDEAWGYVTARGSESNLLGLHYGAMKLQATSIICSEAAHYSVDKAAQLMRCRLVKVPTVNGGEINLAGLRRIVEEIETPPILCLTVGTTMSGAVDDVAGAIDILRRESIPHYVHVDAALGGLIVPFLEDGPAFDFRLGIDSICVSGHKMLGTPVPCSVFVCRKDSMPAEQHVQYIGATDYTLGGSRSGLAPILIREALEYYRNDLGPMVRECRANAEVLADKLCHMKWPYYLDTWSTTVVIQRPPAEVCRKYQLAVEGDKAHVICMPHVTWEVLREFLNDLKASK